MSGVYTQGPGSGPRDTTLRDLFAVVFKRKWLILGIFLITTVSVLGKTLNSPVTFSADATLMLNRQGVRASQLERQHSPLPWIEAVESEVEVLKSTPVLEGAVERLRKPDSRAPEGAEYTVPQIERAISAGVIGESNVLYVTGTSQSQSAAIRIANAVAQSYVDYHQKLFAVPDASGYLQERADSTLVVVQQLQEKRAQLLSGFGLTDLGSEERTLIQARGRLQEQLLDLQRKATSLRTAIEDGRTYLEADTPPTAVPFVQTMGTADGQAISMAAHSLRGAMAELEQLRAKYTDRHPQVAEARQQAAQFRADLEAAVSHAISVKQYELHSLEAEEGEIQKEILRLDGRLAVLPELIKKVEQLDSGILSAQKQFNELSEKAVASEINAASFQDYSVKLLSPALTAQQNQKGDLVRLALGPLLALMAGIGLAFYLENLDHSLRNREDVEQHLEIPVLASFPDADISESNREGSQKIPYRNRKRTG